MFKPEELKNLPISPEGFSDFGENLSKY